MTTLRGGPATIGLALAACALASAARAGPLELYYERTLMSTAGARCNLFSPDVAASLNASAVQARGVALRGGATDKSLETLVRRAQLKAYGVDCKSKDLTIAAERVRTAFAGYGKIWKMNFPGAHGDWQADRADPGKRGEPRWRLAQSQGQVRFGLLADGPNQALTAVLPSLRAAGASGARLILRDPSRAAKPYLDPRKSGLAGALPPRASTLAILASSRAPAPESVGGGVAFSFPGRLGDALAGLDPREAVVLELVFPTRDGERVEATLFEVGDFAAGRAFLATR